MCYFIHLKVTEEGKKICAEELMKSISDKSNDIKIEGQYPNFTLTDGMCSCNFVHKDGKKSRWIISSFKTFFRTSQLRIY